MKNKIVYMFIAVMLLGSLWLAACTAQPATTASPPAPAAPSGLAFTQPAPTPSLQPQYGGVLRIREASSPKSIGWPPELTTTNWTDSQPAVECLLLYPKKGAVPDPWLAEKWQYSSDYKSLTLYLKKGVKFHDGTDFNADAVKWNLDQQRGVKSEMNTVSSEDVIDNYTVRLNLTQYNNSLLMTLVGSIGQIVSPTAAKKNGTDWARMNPVGTGPFKFVSYERDVALKYQRFDGYWGGKPYLDGVEFDYVADPTVADMQLQKGQLDVIVRANPKDARDMVAAGFKTSMCPGVVQCLGWDSVNASSPFAKLEVRQAVEYAIDKAAICKAVGYGFWDPCYQICPPSVNGYNSNLPNRSYNPDKARELLKTAGYPNGFKTQVIISTAAVKDLYVDIQGYLAAVGIDMQIQAVDPALASTYQMGSTWTNAMVPVGPAGMEPYSQTIERMLSTAQYVSVQRPPGWQDQLSLTLAAKTNQDWVALTQNMVKLAYDNEFVAPIYFQQVPSIKQNNVYGDGITSENYSQFFWTPSTAWISK